MLGFPHHFLDNNQVMNVVPRHYGWTEFYDRLLDLTQHSFTARAIARRWFGQKKFTARTINFLRAVSSEGWGRERHYKQVRRAYDQDRDVRRYLEQETTELPQFYVDKMRSDLGPFWDLLPRDAVEHDAYAYLKKAAAAQPQARSADKAPLDWAISSAPTKNIQTDAAAANM